MKQSFNQEVLEWVIFLVFSFLMIGLILVCLIDVANGYTTEESLVLTKISTNANLSETQTITFLDLIAKDENTISNETNLITEIQTNLENDIETLNDDFNSYMFNTNSSIDLLRIEIETLKEDLLINISNIKPENDEVAVLEKQIELIETLTAQKEEAKLDPFELAIAKYLNSDSVDQDKVESITTQNMSSYLNINQFLDNQIIKNNDGKYKLNFPTTYASKSSLKELTDKVEDTYFWWNVILSALLIFIIYQLMNQPSSQAQQFQQLKVEDVVDDTYQESKKERGRKPKKQ